MSRNVDAEPRSKRTLASRASGCLKEIIPPVAGVMMTTALAAKGIPLLDDVIAGTITTIAGSVGFEIIDNVERKLRR